TGSTVYYYRAAAQNGGGTVKGSILSFTTLSLAPPAPALASPTNGVTNQPTSLTLSWSAAPGATSYRLQVSSSSTFSPLFLDDATLTTTSRVVSGLSSNTAYYWRVSASNAGGTGPNSNVWAPTTGAAASPAPPPVARSAAGAVSSSAAILNGSVNPNGTAATAWFEWGTSSTLASYSSTTSQSIGSGSTSVATNSSVGSLAASTTYYYRAAGQNSGGTQRGSIMSFTTLALPPAAPAL